MVSKYAAVVLLGIKDGQTDEISAEFEDEADLAKGLGVILAKDDWQAITIVHSEDFPALMEGAMLR